MSDHKITCSHCGNEIDITEYVNKIIKQENDKIVKRYEGEIKKIEIDNSESLEEIKKQIKLESEKENQKIIEEQRKIWLKEKEKDDLAQQNEINRKIKELEEKNNYLEQSKENELKKIKLLTEQEVNNKWNEKLSKTENEKVNLEIKLNRISKEKEDLQQNIEKELKQKEINLERDFENKLEQIKISFEKNNNDQIRELKEKHEKELLENELSRKRQETKFKEALANMESSNKSQEFQGEASEEMIKNWLKEWFKFDDIKDVSKGVKGADLIQIIGGLNQILNEDQASKIIYEIKDTKSWKDEWKTKLLKDITKFRNSYGIIITKTLPRDMIENKESVKILEGGNIIIMHANKTILQSGLLFIREAIIQYERLKNNSSEFIKDKLFEIITSQQYRQNITLVNKYFEEFKLDLDKLKKQFDKYYKDQLTRVQYSGDAISMIRSQVEILLQDNVNNNSLNEEISISINEENIK